MKRIIVVLAALVASVVSTPAMAWGETEQKALIGLGAFVLGRATAPQPQYVPQPQYSAGQYARPGYAPPVPIMQVADPKTGGTPCVSRSYGWTGVWTTLSDSRRVCVKQ